MIYTKYVITSITLNKCEMSKYEVDIQYNCNRKIAIVFYNRINEQKKEVYTIE